MTIEDRVKAHLNPVLAECLTQRTAAGVAKYGQRLDTNNQPVKARAVHLIQELLDAAQYALWVGDHYAMAFFAETANIYQVQHALTAEEIMTGGKQ